MVCRSSCTERVSFMLNLSLDDMIVANVVPRPPRSSYNLSNGNCGVTVTFTFKTTFTRLKSAVRMISTPNP